MLRISLFMGFLLLSPVSWSGQITLDSGDQIQGTIDSIGGGQVVWQSPALGELKIPVSLVRDLETSVELRIRGKSVPCAWESLTDQYVTFTCDDGDELRVSMLTLDEVLPFEGHEEALYIYGGNLRATGWKQSGNTESQHWEIITDVRLRYSDIRHNFRANLKGQSTQDRNFATGEVTEARTRASKAEYKLDWFFLPQWFWTNNVSFEADDNLNIREQYVGGSGLGFQFWESDQTSLSLEAGLQHSRTYRLLNPGPNEPDGYTSLRLGGDYRYRFDMGLNLYHTSELTHSLEGPEEGEQDRWQFRSDTGVNFPVAFGVSADMSVQWNFTNHARDLDPNATRRDVIYRVGVSYAW